ncbi:hypothetical protein [Lactobacillus sp. ESL0228]|uniref:hypothetical protein n=1 Tax=Lactobacillus sp. ESL0228 TaxID=2069352 RepID=UPI00131488D7|nr:hypothetical protein [Lactobacillus sp. ESL0228]
MNSASKELITGHVKTEIMIVNEKRLLFLFVLEYKNDDVKNIKSEVINTIKKYLEDNIIASKDLSLNSNLIIEYDLEEKFDIKLSNNMQNYDILLLVNKLAQYIIL